MALRPADESALSSETRLRLENERLAVLARYEPPRGGSEADFDHIARLAAHLFNAPIAAVTLVGACEQAFTGCHGLAIAQTPRDVSFLPQPISSPVVMSSSSRTRRATHAFADNPFVTGEPHLRFYAGATAGDP